MADIKVIFDMDGVIVHSEPVILKAAIAALAEYGINAKKEDFRDFIGSGEDLFVGGVARKHGVEYKFEMKHRTYDLYDDFVKGNLHVYPETVKLIRALREAGIGTALASSADRRKVLANLTEAGLSVDDFDVTLSGDDVTHKKPHPEIYLKAAELLHANPCDCIVMEDAVNGINAARAAGMSCIAVTTSFTREALEQVMPPNGDNGLLYAIMPDLSEALRLIMNRNTQ